MKHAALVCALWLASFPALADEIIALDATQEAPFDGILVSEDVFRRVAEEHLQLETTQGQLRVRDELVASLTEQLATARASIGEACKTSWWASNGWMVGFGLGVLAAGAAVWGAVAVLDAR